MDKRKLYGVVCASVCPMHADGSVDFEGVRRLTRHLVDSGIHCLYPNGTNGESLSLTAAERQKIAQTIHEENSERAVLYVQCGAGTVKESYEHVRASAALGVDGAGLMTPVFFPMDDAAMALYFDEILNEVTDFPLYAYNIPTRSGNDLAPKMLGALMERHPNLLGVKYSYPDVLRLERYADCCRSRRASVLVGNDSLATACMMAGGDGWVSGPAAVFPKRHVRLYEALKAGRFEEAAKWQVRIRRTADSMADIPEIPAIKYMLMQMGVVGCDFCRPPFRPLTAEEKSRLDAILNEVENED